MSQIFIPEAVLLDSLTKFLKFVIVNFKSKTTEQETWLYKVLVGTKGIQRHNFYNEAKNIFLTDFDDPKRIPINLFFNPDKQGLPAIHITLPSEQQKNNSLGNGMGIGAMLDNGTTYQESYTRRFTATYNILISGTNVMQVIAIYHVLRALIITLRSHLELSGVENISISGRDVTLNPDLIPINTFVRGIGLAFEYNTGAYDITELPFITELNFEGTAKL